MSEGFILMAVGMAVVFVALALLMGVIALIRRVLEKPAPKTTTTPETATESHEEVPEIDGQLIAILTAATTAVLGAKARVYRVRFIGDDPGTGRGWVQQGRSGHHGSHRLQSH